MKLVEIKKPKKRSTLTSLKEKVFKNLFDNLGIVDSPDTREAFTDENRDFSSQIFGKRFSSRNVIEKLESKKLEILNVECPKSGKTGTILDLNQGELVHIFKFCCPYEILELGTVNLPFLKASIDENLWEFHTRNTFLTFEKCATSYFDLVWKPTFFIYVNNGKKTFT